VCPPDDPLRPSPSIAARLRERCGADVDPRVELAQDDSTRPERVRAAASSASSGVIERLGARGPAATRYKVGSEIARGGMGAILEVFDEDLRRRLAMKVMLDRESGAVGTPAESANPVHLARFLEEAQVTGQLDHPGIVPVHELGLDAAGQVYFTMRLVHGRDLETICELADRGAEGWTTTRVLGVLLKVCEAMSYAHAKGVVHRDLKPANVMVGRFGEVYVMDWGLARVRDQQDRHDVRPRVEAPAERAGPEEAALGPAGSQSGRSLRVETERRSGASTLHDALRTMDGDVVGTPSYMAPEQARGEVEALDERSDVYAVGAMLYRLLAGTAPYTAPGEQVGAVEVWKRVLSGPPAALEATGVHGREAPAELVAVCEKAMARERDARYADMQALGEDLRAFLEGRVVRAFEAGAVAEARKWVRRNKPLAAALASVVVVLVAGLATSLVLADEARASAVVAREREADAARSAELAEQRRHAAEASAQQARREQRIAQDANSFLNDDLLAALAPENQGVDVTVRQVLDRAALQLELRFHGEPQVEAALHRTIGTSYQRLGQSEAALRHLERAAQLWSATRGADEPDALEIARAAALVRGDLGQHAQAIRELEQLLERAHDLFGPEHRLTLLTTVDLAGLLRKAGRRAESRALYGQLMPQTLRVLGPDDPNTLAAENNLALLDQEDGHYVEAERRLRRVLEARRAAEGDEHPQTLIAQSNLANTLVKLGRLDEAEELTRASLAVRRERFGLEHPFVARELGILGSVLFARGQLREAREVFREELRIKRQVQGAEHLDTLEAELHLSMTLDEPGQAQEKLALARHVVAGRTERLGRGHLATLEAMNTLAVTLRDQRQREEAERLFEETLAGQRALLGAEHPSALVSAENLAGLYFQRGEHARGEALVREVLDGRRRALGEAHPDVTKTIFNLGLLLKAQGQHAAAIEQFEVAQARMRATPGPATPLLASCLRALGDAQDGAKDRAAALPSYQAALAAQRELGPDEETVGYLLHQIGAMHALLEQHAEALPFLGEAVEVRERTLGPDAVGTRISLHMQARSLLALKRYAEAEPLALGFLERTQRGPQPDPNHVARGRQQLVELYEGWGKPEEADKWR